MFLDKLLKELLEASDHGLILNLTFFGNKLSFEIPIMIVTKNKLDKLLAYIKKISEPYYISNDISHCFEKTRDVVKVDILFTHPVSTHEIDKQIIGRFLGKSDI